MKHDSRSTTLTIEKVVYGGSGLAHLPQGATGRRAIFVPFTLPSESVEVQITAEHNGFLEAELLRILHSSRERVEPACVHFGGCGGCHYQHASYAEQLRLKQAILQETLNRAGLDPLPEIHTLSAEPWAYRNRIRLRLAEVEGRMRVGYLRRGSSEFLPIDMCPIAAPILWRAAETVLSLDGRAQQYLRSAEEIEFFTNSDQQALQMTIFCRRQPPGFPAFCEAVKLRLPELSGAGVVIMEGTARRRKGVALRASASWGAEGLNYSVAGETYWVTRGGFFQVNRYIVDRLVEIVTKGRRGRLAWDLYAGVGLFSRVLARNFDEVVAVEAAAQDLLRTFRGTGRRAVDATTLNFLRQAVLQRERPELVVMDPPRAGLGLEVCSLLARIRPTEMVYVSCDPATLGRDLRAMVDSGYKLNQLYMVDMFPQTFHQETIAVLQL